jgi:3-hydroxyacyl-CoA dehydrogenase
MMKYHIHKAVVIGSGTMGAAIAAHLANAGVPVKLLDIVPKDAPEDDKAARNKIVNEGWERCLKARPANLMSSELKTLVKLGNLEDDFGAVAEADWICEAIIENLEIKRDLMARIDEVRKQTSIVSTNTSGFCNSRGTLAGIQKTFPRDAFFQSAALFEITGNYPDQRH